jgi:two-component system response regulator WspF
MRIGIANDNQSEILRQIIVNEQTDEIAWIAHNKEEAIKKCANDTPDLVLIDPNMPDWDGVEVIRKIMSKYPCPILVVTGTVVGSAATVFKAIGYGALDAVDTPTMGNDIKAQRSKEIFLKKIRTIAKLCGTCPSKKIQNNKIQNKPKIPISTAPIPPIPPLITIGSSTGGPKALLKVLSCLPSTLKASIVIIQHVNEEFSAGFASWLNAHSSLPVCLALKGEQLKAGTVYVAGTNDHLILTKSLRFAYTPEPCSTPYRPSVDVFFRSVAKYWPDTGVAVLLTGMGRDGSVGLAILRQIGWHTIAQDETTSIVYGMPKAAKELNAATEILPLENISSAILHFLKSYS